MTFCLLGLTCHHLYCGPMHHFLYCMPTSSWSSLISSKTQFTYYCGPASTAPILFSRPHNLAQQREDGRLSRSCPWMIMVLKCVPNAQISMRQSPNIHRTLSYIGCESKLNANISTYSIFPDNYTVYRKDQNQYGGRRFFIFFIAARDNITVSESNAHILPQTANFYGALLSWQIPNNSFLDPTTAHQTTAKLA